MGTSAAAVEVAHRPLQDEEVDGNDNDSDVDFEVGSDDLSASVSNADELMVIVDEALAAESEEELENVDMEVDFDGVDSDFGDTGINDFVIGHRIGLIGCNKR